MININDRKVIAEMAKRDIENLLNNEDNAVEIAVMLRKLLGLEIPTEYGR